MERWEGKIAVVTGANRGLGLAITKKLLSERLTVVGLDKSIDTLKGMMETEDGATSRLNPLQVDLSSEEDIVRAFLWVENNFGGVDVLVNNAGTGGTSSLLDGSQKEWRRIIDVNVIAPVLCAKEAVASMIKRQVSEGHIININSNLSHYVPTHAPFHFYSASKHAARALTEGLRQELYNIDVPIRITGLCPGLIKTGIFQDSLGEKAHNHIYDNHPYIHPEDVAETVQFVLSSPDNVMVSELTVKPRKSVN